MKAISKRSFTGWGRGKRRNKKFVKFLNPLAVCVGFVYNSLDIKGHGALFGQ
jgi:hypothetical protein